MNKSFLLLFLFCSLASANHVNPPHAEVRQSNDALANSFNHYNASTFGLPFDCTPSFDCPIYFFEVKLFTAYPSVGSLVSPKNSTNMLWGWGENHGSGYTKQIPSPKCGFITASRDSDGIPTADYFDAVMNLTIFDNETNSTKNIVRLTRLCEGDSCLNPPNPSKLNFTSNELEKAVLAENESAPNLKIKLIGVVRFPYRDTLQGKTWAECPPDCSYGCACGCMDFFEEHFHQIVLNESTELNYTIFKPASISRFIQSNLNSRDNILSTVVFSQNLIYKTYALLDGKIIDAAYFFEFEKRRHPNYGFWWIDKKSAEASGVKQGDDEANRIGFSNASGSFTAESVNCSKYPEYLAQCIQSNNSDCTVFEQAVASCAVLPQRFYASFHVSNASLGTREMKISEYDIFGAVEEIKFVNNFKLNSFLSLHSKKISGEQVRVNAFLKSESGTPVANAQIIISTSEDDATAYTDAFGIAVAELNANASHDVLIQASFPGSEQLEPTQAHSKLSIPQQHENIFGVLAIVIALVIGLGGGIRLFKGFSGQ